MAKLPCPPELWLEFSALLDDALDIPENERTRWLAGLGAEYTAVRPWVARVLAGITASGDTGFMQGPMLEDGSPSEFVEGQTVGPYRLKHRLGSGGMGEVWLASRSDGTLNRQVALKLPHVHLFAGVLRRRFERERDILSGLSHPHIAQLYDAGVADSKHPYLAMEWVDGIPINEHCRKAKLSLAGRLDLFLQVLEAVGHAHGRLIAHRDLKPSNILVTRDERVKLLDFGIAKLLAGDTETGATELTRIGSCMATPGYAAPEQLAGQPITVAVDLYALGVVLHELLTGQRPYKRSHPTPVHDDGAERASARIEPGHGESVGGLDTKQLRLALCGDLDAIIAKALAPDPAYRYRSAEAFAQDIQLSRQHRPISALRITPATLTLKFIRRHWVVVTLSAGLLLLLIGGSAGIAWQAIRAEREAQRATAIKDFLVGVFRASDPRSAADLPRGEITARDLLDASSQQIEVAFARQPETQVELLGVIAEIYRELDETKRSTALYSRETELATEFLGATDPNVIDGLLGQAYNADVEADDARALKLLTRADPLIHRAHLDQSALRARWLLMRGEASMNDARKGDDAEALLQAAAALFEKVAPKEPRYPDALTDLGNLALEGGRFAQAADFYEHAIAVVKSSTQSEGNLLLANAGLALALRRLGNFDGAAAAFERGAGIAARTYGRNSRDYRLIASDWAQFRYERGDRSAAFAQFDELLHSLPEDGAGFGNATDALEAAQVLRKYGRCLANDGQGARAIPLLERAQSLLPKSATHPADAATLQLDLGKAYEAGGHPDEARAAFHAALEAFKELRAPSSQLGAAQERWGRFLLAQNDLDGAAAAFNEALRLAAGQSSEFAVYAQAGLAALALAREDTVAAQQTSSRALHQLDELQGFYDIRIKPYVWSIRARSLLLAGEIEESLDLATRAREAALMYYDPGSRAVSDVNEVLRYLSRRTTTRELQTNQRAPSH